MPTKTLGTSVIYRTPPTELLKECPSVDIRGEYTRDLVDAYLRALKSISECNLDKAALRQWVSEVERKKNEEGS